MEHEFYTLVEAITATNETSDLAVAVRHGIQVCKKCLKHGEQLKEECSKKQFVIVNVELTESQIQFDLKEKTNYAMHILWTDIQKTRNSIIKKGLKPVVYDIQIKIEVK